jgi:hypothetical protein
METFYDYGETIDQPDYNVRFAAHDLGYTSYSQKIHSIHN